MIGRNPELVGIPKPAPKSIKVRVAPNLLPMFATICPVKIAGSFETKDGTVGLVLEGEGLPDAEYGTVFCERDGCKSVVTINAIDA